MIFGERLTPRLMLGILMILVAVTFIVVGKSVMEKINHLFYAVDASPIIKGMILDVLS